MLKLSITVTLLIIASVYLCAARDAAPSERLTTFEKAVVFAIEQEIETANFKNRRDLCVGFDTRLKVNEKGVISELRRHGFKVRRDSWCIRGLPRGLSIAVLGGTKEISPGAYDIGLALSDFWPIRSGEHFGTLLRRGTYVISIQNDSAPRVVSYRADASK
jgi:hypothetical protein